MSHPNENPFTTVIAPIGRPDREPKAFRQGEHPAVMGGATDPPATDVAPIPLLFFDSREESPYDELNIWCPCEFLDPEVHESHTFTSLGQYMFYRKALVLLWTEMGMPGLTEKRINKGSEPTGSKISTLPYSGWRDNATRPAYDVWIVLLEDILEGDIPERFINLDYDLQHRRDHELIWANAEFEIALQGTYCKFGQDYWSRRCLFGTGDRELAWATSEDRDMGIGYDAVDAEAHRAEWGRNLLGKALMQIRDRLELGLEEDTSSSESDEGHTGGQMAEPNPKLRSEVLKEGYRSRSSLF